MGNKMGIFSTRLKELRKEFGVKQSDMAEVLGCTVSHYQKIEYDEVNVPTLTLMKLADYFDVSLDYLVGRRDERN